MRPETSYARSGGCALSQSTCDYVILGAGSAGCVLARRLAERSGARSVVVEQGGEAPRGLRVPAHVRRHLRDHLHHASSPRLPPGLD